jgi:ABC-type polysaccharide/polyol phosphate export permease
MTRLAELSESRELLVNLTLRELRGKYKRSLLGWSWSLVNPLATMAIFTVVFLYFLKVPVPRGDPSGLHVFALFLLCGLLPWNFLANGMTGSMGAVLGNANLIKKVYFPRELLVAATVASWTVSLLVELGVLAAAMLIAGNAVLPWLPGVLLLVALQTVFVLGIGLLLGVLNVFFRDVQHFVGIVLQIWFYATPVVYPLTVVPRTADIFGHEVPVRFLYGLNPMVRFVEAYRSLLYHVRAPSLGDIGYLALVSGAMLAVGLIVFNRLEPALAEEL